MAYSAAVAIAPATDSGGPFSADTYFDFGAYDTNTPSQTQNETLTPTATAAEGGSASTNAAGAGTLGALLTNPTTGGPSATLYILIFAGIAIAGVAAIYLVHKKG